MKNMKIWIAAVWCLAIATGLFAQQDKAQKMYNNMGYAASVGQLLKDKKESELTKEEIARVANSYRLNADTRTAEYWYAKYMTDNKEPEQLLRYSQVLLSNGKCEEAVRTYNEFLKNADDATKANRGFVTNCTEMQKFDRQGVEITNVEFANSTALDFSPVKYADGLMFTSNRGGGQRYNPETNLCLDCGDRWTRGNFTDLFYAKKNDKGGYDVEAVETELNKKYHDGTPTFNKAGDKMFFTRNNYKGKSKDGLIDLKVCSAELKNGSWTNVKYLPFNSDEFASAHPTLSADGKRLYFSSNRPGGLGGMDIYVSNLTDNVWGDPKNLGNTVNSAGNETFPFIGEDESLYYSSDGFAGYGGLDIYKATKNSDGAWAKRTNMGAPFNSANDDLGFTTTGSETEGYFASNRAGGKGLDDIYSFKSDKSKLRPEPRRIVVYDAKTGQNLEDVVVNIIDLDDANGARRMLTDKDGKVIAEIKAEGGKYKFDLTKGGYKSKTVMAESAEIMAGDEYRIPMDKAPAVPFEGLVRNKVTGLPILGAKVRLLNRCTGKTQEFTTDANGKFTTALDCDCEYELIATKDGFFEERTTISTKGIDCEKTPKKTATLELMPREQQTFKKGDIIVLKDIYYDFDKANIRPDAQPELDKVVRYMLIYPSMEIELGSHTDCRGTDGYNENLSQRRAESAVKYIISRGVAKSRIKAQGYGEQRLVNACACKIRDNKCTDQEHQDNRRTEILITQFNEPDVEVQSRRK